MGQASVVADECVGARRDIVWCLVSSLSFSWTPVIPPIPLNLEQNESSVCVTLLRLAACCHCARYTPLRASLPPLAFLKLLGPWSQEGDKGPSLPHELSEWSICARADGSLFFGAAARFTRLASVEEVRRALQAPASDPALPIADALRALREQLNRQPLPASSREEEEALRTRSCSTLRLAPVLRTRSARGSWASSC